MRIVQVLPWADRDYGGPVAVADLLTAHLMARGHEVRICAGRPRDRWWQGMVGRYWLDSEGRRNLTESVLWADLIHVHGVWNFPGTLASRRASRAGKGLVVTPHGMLRSWAVNNGRFKKRAYYLLVERYNLRLAHRLHFLNHTELSEASRFRLRVGGTIIPNGINWAEWQDLPARRVLEGHLPQVGDRLIGLFLGRIATQKGLDLLLSSLTSAFCERLNFCLIVAGMGADEPYLAKCQEIIRTRCLGDHVVWYGPAFDQQKRELLGAADFFVLPSRSEGDSVALKEALAAGLPSIITSECSAEGVVESGAGLAVKPDAEALRGAITELTTNDSLRMNMGLAARNLAEAAFDAGVVADRMVELYRGILRECRPGQVTE